MFAVGSILVIIGCLFGLGQTQIGHNRKNAISNLCIEKWKHPGKFEILRPQCCFLPCPDYILPHEKKYGLSNQSRRVRRQCSCDIEFYNCLTENLDIKSIKTIRGFFRGERCFDVYYAHCYNGGCKYYYDLFPSVAIMPRIYKNDVFPTQ